MNRIKLFTFCFLIITLFFSLTSYAEDINYAEDIKEKLENKTIKSYHTVLAPLKGDPEHFNILPTDDLNTIQFGDGVRAYRIDYKTLKEAYNQQSKDIKNVLIASDSYYFPVIVSGRPVAMAEVVVNNGEYKVISVASGSIFDNFIQTIERVDIEKAKYVKSEPVANGFILEGAKGQQFIDLDSDLSVVRVDNTEYDLISDFHNRYENAAKSEDLIGAGNFSKDNESTDLSGDYSLAIILIALLVLCVLIAVYKKRKNTN